MNMKHRQDEAWMKIVGILVFKYGGDITIKKEDIIAFQNSFSDQGGPCLVSREKGEDMHLEVISYESSKAVKDREGGIEL